MSWLKEISFMDGVVFLGLVPVLVVSIGIVGLGLKRFSKFVFGMLSVVAASILVINFLPMVAPPILNILKVGVDKVINWIGSIPYNESAILTMAQVEGVLAGIALPLGLEMIAKIADRYNSTSVNTYFKRKGLLRWYPFVMLGMIPLTLLPVVLLPSDADAPFFVIFASVLFVAAVIASAFFLNLLRSYMGSGYLLEELCKSAEKAVK